MPTNPDTQAVSVADAQVVEALDAVKIWTSRSTNLIAVGLMLLFMGFVALIIIINSQRQAAEDRAAQFEKKANAAASTLEQVRQAYAARDMAKVGVLLKVAIIQTETLAASAKADTSRTAPDATALAGQIAVNPRATTPVTVDAVSIARPQTVYIQFAGRIARGRIVALNTALRSTGWRVSGKDGERTANAAGLNEVRFHGEEDRAAADALAATLTGASVGGAPVTARQLDVIRPGVLEVWISR